MSEIIRQWKIAEINKLHSGEAYYKKSVHYSFTGEMDKLTSQANREKVKMNELFDILRQYVFLNNDAFENNTYSGKMRLTILDAISDHKFISDFKIFVEQQSSTWSPELKEISAQTIKQLFLAIRSFRKLLHQDEKVKNTKELVDRETKLLD